MWNEAQYANCTFDESYLADLSKKNKAIVADIRMQVAEIIPLLGIQAAQLDSEINIDSEIYLRRHSIVY